MTVKATNIYGQSETKTIEETYKDEQGPTCIIADADKSRTNDDWIAADRTITVGCDDGPDGSGCAREEFTKTFKTDAQTDFIIIKDKSGNETACEVDVYIDKTKPHICNVKHSGTKGTNQWYVTNASVSLNAEDAMSGIKYKSLTTESTKPATYNQLSSGTQTDTKGIIWYGYVEDYAGNKTNCFSTNFKVDTTAPTQPSGGSITISGSTEETTLGEVSGSTDDTSGFKEYRYVVKNDATVPTNGDSGFTTSRTFTRSCGTSYYAYAIAVDNAGNKSTVHFIGSGYDNKNEYVNYSACTKQCDTGTQTASNECALITDTDTRNCNTRACCTASTVTYTQTSTCSKTCGGGTYKRQAYSSYDSSVRCSSFDDWSGTACGTADCCSDVSYGSWSDWSKCTKDCDTGTQTRTRTKTSKYDSSNCGTDTETQKCNTHSCFSCDVSSSTVFGTSKGSHSGNYGGWTNAGSSWGNWCNANGTTCNASGGYVRICIHEACKGMTVKEVNAKWGCDYASLWCSCK